MAIQFDPNALSMFSGVNFGIKDGIVASGKLEGCMEVLFKTYFGLQYIERDLEQFRKTNLAEDVRIDF